MRTGLILILLAAPLYGQGVVNWSQHTGWSAGGASPWTPANCSNCVSWWDASDAATITESSGSVSQWDDKIGSNDLTNSGDDPNYDSGNDEIEFEASEYLSTSITHASTDHFLACMVATIPSGDGFGYAWAPRPSPDPRGDGGFIAFHLAGTTLRNGQGFSNRASVGSSAAMNSMKVLCSASDGGNAELWYDGTEGTSTGTITATANTGVSFGVGLGSPFSLDAALTIVIKEAIYVVGYDFSDAERQCIEGYLAHQHGLEAGLPGGHPFASAAPTTSDTCP